MHNGIVSGNFNNTGEKKAVGKQAFFFPPCHYKIVSEETTTIFFSLFSRHKTFQSRPTEKNRLFMWNKARDLLRSLDLLGVKQISVRIKLKKKKKVPEREPDIHWFYSKSVLVLGGFSRIGTTVSKGVWL